MSLSKRILGEDGGPGLCAFCGFRLGRGDDFPDDETRRFGGGTWKVHGECAIVIDREAKQCSPDEHDWPAELDGSECNRCGQEYDTWTQEES